MDADGKVFHKTCMKCEHCACRLSLGNYAALNGKYYCKTHFKQLFKTKGNYTEGFGEEDAKKKWSPQVSHFNMSGVNFGSGSSTIKQRAMTVGPISQAGSHKSNDADTESELAPAANADAQAQAPVETQAIDAANPQATPDASPSAAAAEEVSDLGEVPAPTEGGGEAQQQEPSQGSDAQSEGGSAGEAAEGNGADDTATTAAIDSSAEPGDAPAAEAGDATAADNSGDVA
ncbi:LIM domain containing protein [Acanthamoeba castellanii str. Neff]|uniref:LIM domain containing protein n=1 Tax=Acanthamoeba castellanii (strain ATCC 30010 / Neff) TaxID=1257118 RepID=L8GMJ9_ACACF|nr:LIM domain containing protein [Acanthamoeba castellanii str. Neff]ELR14202.1 LIM domain containing protein [Acanthamoeba castellanii str. Neff]